EHEVDQPKPPRQVEEPHPPARQRIVVLGEVAVPYVAVKLGLLRPHRPLDALRLEQHDARDDAHKRHHGDAPAKKAAREVAHRSPSAPALWARTRLDLACPSPGSSSNGNRA